MFGTDNKEEYVIEWLITACGADEEEGTPKVEEFRQESRGISMLSSESEYCATAIDSASAIGGQCTDTGAAF